MHIQIVQFHLEEISVQDYGELCDELAPAFTDLPGLISKVWLADPASQTFGGLYLWENREAMESFQKSELFHAVATHPNLADVTCRDFQVLDGPTRITRGFAAVA